MWPIDRVMDSKSKGMWFNPHCWSCVEVSDKLLIPHCLCLPSSDGYLVDENCELVAQADCMLVRWVYCILPGEMRLLKWCMSYTREGNWLVAYAIDIRPWTMCLYPYATLLQKGTIHQVTTMPATFKNVLFPCHNWWPDNLIISTSC